LPRLSIGCKGRKAVIGSDETDLSGYTICSSKRVLGRRIKDIHASVKRDFENSEVKLVPLSAPSPYENAKLKNPYAAFQLQNGDIVQAQNAAADLLAKVREHAEKYLVQDALQKANLTKLTHAVVTCPAWRIRKRPDDDSGSFRWI
jgi:molecular chaperone DnaK (HSP70)